MKELKEQLAELFKSGQLEIIVNIYPNDGGNFRYNAIHVEVRIDGQTIHEYTNQVDLVND